MLDLLTARPQRQKTVTTSTVATSCWIGSLLRGRYNQQSIPIIDCRKRRQHKLNKLMGLCNVCFTTNEYKQHLCPLVKSIQP